MTTKKIVKFWQTRHATEMQSRFQKFDADKTDPNGWDPKASTVKRQEYFEAVTNDANTPFGRDLTKGNDGKLPKKNFLSNYKTQSEKYFQNSGGTGTAQRATAPPARRIASAVHAARAELARDDSSDGSDEMMGDVERETNENDGENCLISEHVQEEQMIRSSDGTITFPLVQISYTIAVVGCHVQKKIYLIVPAPAGWLPSKENSLWKNFIKLSPDGNSLILTFTASPHQTDPIKATRILTASSSRRLQNAYGSNNGVMHPAVGALQHAVEQQRFVGSKHSFCIPLLKTCARVCSTEGIGSGPEGPVHLLYQQSSQNRMRRSSQERVTGVLHIELEVALTEDEKQVRRRSILQNSNHKTSGTPKRDNYRSTHHGSGSSAKRGRSNYVSRHGRRGNENAGHNRRVMHGAESIRSLSPTPTTSFYPHPQRREQSHSPFRHCAQSSESSSESLCQFRPKSYHSSYRDQGDQSSDSASDAVSGSSVTSSGSFSDQDAYAALNATASSVDMKNLTESLVGCDIGPITTSKDAQFAQRLKTLEGQMKHVYAILEIVKNDDGTSSSNLLTLLEKQTLELRAKISESISMADQNLSTAEKGLDTSIEQVRQSIRDLRHKIDEQLVLKADLVGLVEESRQETSRGALQSEIDSLKKGMDQNATSITSLQQLFKKQSDDIQSQLEAWGEAGKVISKEVESIKKKQDEMGEIVAQRQMNMTGLYDTIVTPIKTGNGTFPQTPAIF